MAAMTGVNQLVYVMIGCPGSGKGTFAQEIKKEGLEHISTGNIMREELDQKTEIGLQYEKEIKNHDPMPLPVIQKVVEQRLKKALQEKKGIILDGFPRFKEQCEFLDNFIEKNHLRTVVVQIEVDPQTAIDRIAYRQMCDKCKQVFNLKYSPPKIADECDVCHAKLAKRVDDIVEVTTKRVHKFEQTMKDVIEYYSHSGKLKLLDGNGEIGDCVGRYLAFHLSQKV